MSGPYQNYNNNGAPPGPPGQYPPQQHQGRPGQAPPPSQYPGGPSQFSGAPANPPPPHRYGYSQGPPPQHQSAGHGQIQYQPRPGPPATTTGPPPPSGVYQQPPPPNGHGHPQPPPPLRQPAHATPPQQGAPNLASDPRSSSGIGHGQYPTSMRPPPTSNAPGSSLFGGPAGPYQPSVGMSPPPQPPTSTSQGPPPNPYGNTAAPPPTSGTPAFAQEIWNRIAQNVDDPTSRTQLSLTSRQHYFTTVDPLNARDYINQELARNNCTNPAAIKGWLKPSDLTSQPLPNPQAPLQAIYFMRFVEDIRHFFDILPLDLPLSTWLRFCGRFLVNGFLAGRMDPQALQTAIVTSGAYNDRTLMEYALENATNDNNRLANWEGIVQSLCLQSRNVLDNTKLALPATHMTSIIQPNRNMLGVDRAWNDLIYMANETSFESVADTMLETPPSFGAHPSPGVPLPGANPERELVSNKPKSAIIAAIRDVRQKQQYVNLFDMNRMQIEEKWIAPYIIRALIEHRTAYYDSQGVTSLEHPFQNSLAEDRIVEQAFRNFAPKIKEIEEEHRRVNYPYIQNSADANEFVRAFTDSHTVAPQRDANAKAAARKYQREMITHEQRHRANRAPFTMTENDIVNALLYFYRRSAVFYGSIGTGWLYAVLTMKDPNSIFIYIPGPQGPRSVRRDFSIYEFLNILTKVRLDYLGIA